MNLPELFVFDIAGTTVVDSGHVLRAFLRTAAAFSAPVDAAALQQRMGWHKQRVFEEMLAAAGKPTTSAARMATHFEQEFAACVARDPLRPTPGANDVLQALRRCGVRVAFNTGFARVTADAVLRALGWQDLPSVASDEVARGRPHPDLIFRAMELCGVDDPARVGVVGDTPSDLLAGTAAKCRWVVGVACGTHTLEQLQVAPHTHLLRDLRGLPVLLESAP